MSSNASNQASTELTNRFKPKNSDDPGWDYGQPLAEDNAYIVCDFCGHKSKGGIKRFKQHLVKKSYNDKKYKDVKGCLKVSEEACNRIRTFMDEKIKFVEERKRKQDEMMQSVNVYDEYDDNSSIPKKKKGPIDSFRVLKDGSRAPTTKENKNALENIQGYISDFFYENAISFNCAKSDSYRKMMQAIVQYNDPPSFKPPSYNDLRVKILKRKKEQIKQWVEEFKVHWETYGVTIMTDWWTDGKGRTLINFLVNCPKGTIFLKSIDASEHVHDAKLIYEMLKVVIQEVGEKNVVQVCTDNASNYKLAGEWLMEDTKIYWMPCAAHCLNLVLQDVSKLPNVKSVIKDAQIISVFIYNHKHVLHLMREETKGRELIRPSVTRFATTYLCLESMYDKRQQLRSMIHTTKWSSSKWPKHPIGKVVMKKIKSNSFWNNMHTCLKIMAPMVDVLRMVDTEEKPSMPYIYKAMELCKCKVQKNIGDKREEDKELWKKMERIIDNRWKTMLQKPMHSAAHYLNPQYYYATTTSSEEMEGNRVVKEGLLDCIEKLALDNEDENQILRDLVVYRTKGGRLGKKNAQSCITTLAPAEWWVTFGSEVPALQRFARRVLGLTSAASPCERNWSTFSNLHTKKRNCLDHERLRDLAYIQYNMRLKKHFEERINGEESDPIVLKSIDECAEWLTPRDEHDDFVSGADGLPFEVHEEAEDGLDNRPTTRQSRRNTSIMQQELPLSTEPTSPYVSSDDDDESDGDENYGDGEEFGEDDGINSGDDEDLF